MSEALYRKYRSMDFDAMVGQEHVVRLLKEQVARQELSHAYVFSGTRGTGKTSAAKILSRAVNCLAPREGNPCNECAHCRGILSGQILDVVEMDAASHNGVDDIRELRAKAVYPPATVKYRVYIIDEVHMLSKEAFNALLKILEEPPAHLIFILATTEPERIPPTILSRCQRYDFHRLTEEQIVHHMETIVQQEGRQVDREVLELIARHADGAMRDALSLLDQCISWSEGRVSLKEALSILGMVGHERMGTLYAALSQGEGPEVLRILRTWRQEGKDSQAILEELIYFNRQWLIATVDGTNDEVLQRMLTLGDFNQAVRQLELLLDLQGKIKFSPTPDVLLDVTLLSTIIPRNVAVYAEARPTWDVVKNGTDNSQPRTKPVREPAETKPASPPQRPMAAYEASGMEDEDAGEWWVPFEALEEAGEKKEPPVSQPAPVVKPEAAQAVNPAAKVQADAPAPPSQETIGTPQEMASQSAMPMPEETSASGIWPKEEWEAFLDYLSQHAPATRAALMQAKPKHKFDEQLVIGYPQGAKVFMQVLANEPLHKDALEEAAKALWQKDYTVRVEMLGLTEEEEVDLAIGKVVRKFGRDLVEIKDEL